MKVESIMHKGVEWVSPDTTIAAVAMKMRQCDIGAIPVGENDRLVGMVTDRDIAIRGFADGKDPSKLTARDVMTKGVIYCRDNEDVEETARTMETKQIRRLLQPARIFRYATSTDMVEDAPLAMLDRRSCRRSKGTGAKRLLAVQQFQLLGSRRPPPSCGGSSRYGRKFRDRATSSVHRGP